MEAWGLRRLVDFLLNLLRAYFGTLEVRVGDVQSGVDAQREAQRKENEREAAEAAALAAEIRDLTDEELRARAARWGGA